MVKILTRYPPLRFVPFYLLDKHGETEQNTPRRWRTVLGLEEIQYLAEDIDHPDKKVSLGRTAHEIWHVLFSRPELILSEPELLTNMAFQALWWAVEDPRVNTLGLKDHPGARSWLEAAYAKDYEVRDLEMERIFWSQMPLHLQFNYALIYEWWMEALRGRRVQDPRVSDPRVRQALDEAAGALRRAIQEADAKKSFAIIRDEIWPIYKKLVDESYEQARQQEAQKRQQAQKQGQKSGQGQQGRNQQGRRPQQGRPQKSPDQDSDQGQSGQKQDGQSQDGSQSADPSQSGQAQEAEHLSEEALKEIAKQVGEKMTKAERQFRDEHASKLVDNPEKMTEAEREQLLRELEELRKRMQQAQEGDQGQQGQEGEAQEAQKEGKGEKDSGAKAQKGGKGTTDGRPSQKQLDRLRKPDLRPKVDNTDRGAYDLYFNRIRHLVPVMRQQLIQALKRKLRRRTARDQDSGEVDDRALPEIPRGKKDIFEDELTPDKVFHRVSLLIDVSGSMDKEKKDRALEGAILMMEALDKVPGVAYEIVIYADDAKVVKAYGERLTRDVKVAVVKAALNASGSTQSHIALEESMERIRVGRSERLIVVVNDGDPDNNFDRNQYRALIRGAKDIEIHLIGLGPGSQLVLDLAPPGRGWWLKDATDFAKKLQKILKRKLLGSE